MTTEPCTICGEPVLTLDREEDTEGRCCLDCTMLNRTQGYFPSPAPRPPAIDLASIPPVQCRLRRGLSPQDERQGP